jgi:ribosome recycling factor
MDINDYKPKFGKIIDHLKVELAGVRTNRATPAMLENIKVSAYEGTESTIKELASVTAPEPRQLLLEPWDKSVLKNIEKSIRSANLGFSISNEGVSLRLSLPVMTDEIRQQVKKIAREKLEGARVNLRRSREEVKDDVLKAEQTHAISEDEKFKLIEQLDEVTREFSDEIKSMGGKKEAEIDI